MWTDGKVEQLTALWNEGLSCSQIARVLGDGITRNAVIGKVRRLGLPFRDQGAPRPYAIVPRKPRVRLVHDDVPPPVVQDPPALDAEGHHYTTLTIRDGHCRYPFDASDVDGGYIYCGHAVSGDGNSYCGYHASRCRVKIHVPEKRVKRGSSSFGFARAA